ncbi:hypothetical protein J6590_028177 [Homalodisca vitripennis]|nr:hypothetical protein J6590_028177 [Homalodisca vitripennis]
MLSPLPALIGRVCNRTCPSSKEVALLTTLTFLIILLVQKQSKGTAIEHYEDDVKEKPLNQRTAEKTNKARCLSSANRRYAVLPNCPPAKQTLRLYVENAKPFLSLLGSQ